MLKKSFLLILCFIYFIFYSASLNAEEKWPPLFGSMEFQRPIETVTSWLDVMERNANNFVFYPGAVFRGKKWDSLKKSAEDKNSLGILRIVNSFWNKWPYREDIELWGKSDYWAAPYEFIPRSGDCEDYAIAKFYTLKELGFDPGDMRIVVVRDSVRGLAHAVLAVKDENNIYILDNLSKSVLSHNRLRNYIPQYSVNESGRWAHVIPRKKK